MCGVNGDSFINKCFADCAGIEVGYEGRCHYVNDKFKESESEEECVCEFEYSPVCGVDGKTYYNACEAGCKNIAIKHNGICGVLIEGKVIEGLGEASSKQLDSVKDCTCDDGDTEKVCDLTGKRYKNKCEADCEGINDTSKDYCILSEPAINQVSSREVIVTDGDISKIETEKTEEQSGDDGVTQIGGFILPFEADVNHKQISSLLSDNESINKLNEEQIDDVTEDLDLLIKGFSSESYDEEETGNDEDKDIIEQAVESLNIDDEINQQVNLNLEISRLFQLLSTANSPRLKDCKCGDIIATVCADNGQTYTNKCVAECLGFKVVHKGECKN